MDPVTGMLAPVAKKSAEVFLAWLKERKAEKTRAWVEQCDREASQVAGTVAVALVSLALGAKPLDDTVQEFLASLVNEPSAPARARRLLGALLESPSRERRARLAAVFVAGPKICSDPALRDRLDALVEDLFDDDVVVLRQLAECDSLNGLLIEEPHRQAAISGRRRFCSGAASSGPRQWDALPTLPAIALDNLEALRLIRQDGSFSEAAKLSSGQDLFFLHYSVTHLGRFLQESLQHEAIQAGMAVVGDASSPSER